MKKRYLYITTILLSAVALSLSSCLKNSNNYIDFSKAGTIVEFPKGGLAYFSADAVTDPGDTITKQFAITVASANVPTTATTITLSVNDPAIITAYDTQNPAVNFLPMPSNAFVSPPTSVNIPAGQRNAILSVTFYKGLLDPSKSYMLPIAIKSAGGLNISGNQGIHYYHFIGNDFAGAYLQNFQRYNASDSTSVALNGASFTAQPATFSPVSPTEFTVPTGYAAGAFVYDVTFTKNADGTYSNFSVIFTPTSIASALAGGITLTQPPVFFDPTTHQPAASTLAGPYTFAQAKKIFHFQFKAHTTANRYLIDTFY
jgi:hypothetical protein